MSTLTSSYSRSRPSFDDVSPVIAFFASLFNISLREKLAAQRQSDAADAIYTWGL